MALITGTSGDDILIGTNGDDTLVANGGTDILKGKGGADVYQLYFGSVQIDDGPFYTINETKGGDASIDTITGVASLTQYQSGVLNFADFSRSGTSGQNLVIRTPFKPNSYNSTGVESGTIKIVNQYNADTTNAYIEKILIGAVEYNLLNTSTGTAANDIITGWKASDTFFGGAGTDYLSGGRGDDFLYGDAGVDTIFGGKGGDFIYGGTESDQLFGEAGKDKMFGEAGADVLDGGRGNDRLKGNDGNDTLIGGAGNDRIFGGKGNDLLVGGTGNDTMKGSSGWDRYEISADDGGNNLVIDYGRALDQDTIIFTGFASIEAFRHASSFQKNGDDLVMTYEGTLGVTGELTLQNQFLSNRNAVEHIRFETGAGDVLYHFAYLKGDDYTYSVHSGADAGGEDIVIGSSGADQIYGGIGSDILIGGAGVDTFYFHDEGDSRGGADIILDFDLTQEKLDFTEIKTMTVADLTLTENAFGNAVISSIYGTIELDGISAAEITNNIFEFL